MCDVMTAAAATGLAGQTLSQLGRHADARRAAKRAEREAEGRQREARQRADDTRRRASAEAGNRRARFARAGVRLDGSPADVLAALTSEGEQQAARILADGVQAADTLRERARSERGRSRTALVGLAPSPRLLGGLPFDGLGKGGGRWI